MADERHVRRVSLLDEGELGGGIVAVDRGGAVRPLEAGPLVELAVGENPGVAPGIGDRDRTSQFVVLVLGRAVAIGEVCDVPDQIVLVETLPRNAMAKVIKRELEPLFEKRES